MPSIRMVLGGFMVVLLAGSMVGATVMLVPAVGDGPLFGGFSFGTPVQGDSPGVVPPGETPTGPNYVQVTFRFECAAAWCDVSGDETMTLRIQQANRSEFEWEGLYAFDIRDGSEVTVSLFETRQYRLLVKIPNGRIVHLDTHTAEADANVTIRMTGDDI